MQDRLLHYVPLFQGLPEDQMQRLTASGRYKDYRSGELIAGEEERVRGLYLVVWGRVKIYKSSGEGKEQTLYLFGPGELFCLTSLTEDVLPANALAIEDTRVLILPREVMEDMARHEPALLFNMLILLIRRLKESMFLIELLSLKEIPQRVASFFLHALAMGTETDVLELTTSQRELAKIVGTTPETLSRVLRKMKDDGVITLEDRIVRVLDHRALAAISNQAREESSDLG